MRKSLLILCILSITLCASAQQNRKWFEGTIYHTSGEVFDGIVSWEPPLKGQYEDGDQVLYRRDVNAETFPIPYYNLKSFVMGADSFVVSKNVLFKNSPFMMVALDSPTKLYIVKTGKRGLPVFFNGGGGGANFGMGVGFATTVGAGVKSTYYYGTNPNNVTILNKKNFIDIMSTIMADKPEVVDKIKDKTFRYGDIVDLLNYYKTGQIPKKSYDY